MSAKNLDKHQRFRSKTVGFRMSLEENAELDRLIKLSGMTKQDYIIDRLNNKEIIVNPNPRVFKALKNEIISLTDELKRLSNVSEDNVELMEIMRTVVGMVDEIRN
ncbi:MAG: hypothetical protein RR063_09355 [Anaerovoracaceae bacterium]